MSFKRLDEFSLLPAWKACCGHTTWVYGLLDPHDRTVRYIGVSGNPHKRLNFHCQKAVNWKVNEWLQSLRPRKPEVTLLAEVCRCNWDRAEISWIGFFLNSGELYNIHKGGPQGRGRGVPHFAGSRPSRGHKPKKAPGRKSNKKRRKRWLRAQKRQAKRRLLSEIMLLPEESADTGYTEYIEAMCRG